MTRAVSGVARPSTSVLIAPRAMSSGMFSRSVTGAHVKADADAESKVSKRAVIGERVACRISRLVEQQEEAVGASDLAAVVPSDEVAGAAVVCRPAFRRAGVTQALDPTCAVNDVGKE